MSELTKLPFKFARDLVRCSVLERNDKKLQKKKIMRRTVGAIEGKCSRHKDCLVGAIELGEGKLAQVTGRSR